MKITRIAAALLLAGASSFAAANGDYTVFAYENSTSGGTGLDTISLLAGQQFTVSVAADDLWNAGALPRWSNANGLTGNLYYGAGTDAQVPVYSNGTQIGELFPNWSQGGLVAPYGTLVGQIGGGNYFAIGTSYTGTAASSGVLKLFYFDSNNGDNTGSILAHVASVPEPESYALLLAGLGLMGGIARRRFSATA